jgi:hypothetical protein
MKRDQDESTGEAPNIEPTPIAPRSAASVPEQLT